MGYQVYWANGRWQGYGVTAYCDHNGCKKEIDRGMGYRYDGGNGTFSLDVFVCQKHQYCDLETIGIDLNKEHPDWINHVLKDDAWKQWRDENPEIVEKYKRLRGE
jgi:hypothetical protein